MHGMITLKTLVIWHASRKGAYHVGTRITHDGTQDWAVYNLADAVVYANNTQEEAKIICGLCNLLNDADWGTLQPYVDELLPGKRIIPNGVQA